MLWRKIPVLFDPQTANRSHFKFRLKLSRGEIILYLFSNWMLLHMRVLCHGEPVDYTERMLFFIRFQCSALEGTCPSRLSHRLHPRAARPEMTLWSVLYSRVMASVGRRARAVENTESIDIKSSMHYCRVWYWERGRGKMADGATGTSWCDVESGGWKGGGKETISGSRWIK